VELLVPRLDALQDGDRLLLGGLEHADRLEPARQGAVLLDVLPVLAHRGRADAGDLTPRQRRLEDVRRVERTLGGAGADQGVDLVDEDDDLAALLQLLEQALQPFLELAAVLGAGDQQRQVEREDPPVRQQRRHVALDDAGGEALHDRGLADAGIAQQQRVVLGAPTENLDHPLDLAVAADQGVEAAARRQRGQITRVLADVGRRLRGARGLGVAAPLDDLLAKLEQVEPVRAEVPGGGAGLDPQQAEQQVLRADRGVAHALRLVDGEGEGLLGVLGQRQVG